MKIKKLKKLFSKIKFPGRERSLVLAILFVAISVRMFFEFIPSSAEANWFDANWKYRQKVTINNSKVLGEETSFPMLVATTQDALKSIWSGGRMGKVNAGDLVFTAANGTTKLSHEIEKYTFNTGELIAWVKIPTILTTGDQFIYMYYGNDNAVDQWDTTGAVWSDRYKAVYHLGDNCSTAGCYKDSVFGNNATPYSGDTIANLNDNSGKIGRAVSLDGANDYLKIPSSTNLDFTTNFTIEAYSQLNELSRYSGIFDKGAYSLKVGPDKKYISSGRFGENPYAVDFDSVESFGSNYIVTSMAEFKGELFVTIEANAMDYTSIYKSSNGLDFSLAGSFAADMKIGGLSVFKDALYVFVGDTVFVSSNGSSWSNVYTASEEISSMVVFDNYLYIGTSLSGLLYRSLIGSSSWFLAKDFASNEIIDVLSMSVYDGKLFAGGEGGKVLMSSNGTDFSVDEDFGASFVVTAMGVFDGKLWVGISSANFYGGNTFYRNYAGVYTQSNFPAE